MEWSGRKEGRKSYFYTDNRINHHQSQMCRTKETIIQMIYDYVDWSCIIWEERMMRRFEKKRREKKKILEEFSSFTSFPYCSAHFLLLWTPFSCNCSSVLQILNRNHGRNLSDHHIFYVRMSHVPPPPLVLLPKNYMYVLNSK